MISTPTGSSEAYIQLNTLAQSLHATLCQKESHLPMVTYAITTAFTADISRKFALPWEASTSIRSEEMVNGGQDRIIARNTIFFRPRQLVGGTEVEANDPQQCG
jgi:hypothetical protein